MGMERYVGVIAALLLLVVSVRGGDEACAYWNEDSALYYDLNPLADVEYTINSADGAYALAICTSLSAGACAGEDAAACQSTLEEVSYVLGRADVMLFTPLPDDGDGVQITYGAGDTCSGVAREARVNVRCANVTAVTSVSEPAPCRYVFEMGSPFACGSAAVMPSATPLPVASVAPTSTPSPLPSLPTASPIPSAVGTPEPTPSPSTRPSAAPSSTISGGSVSSEDSSSSDTPTEEPQYCVLDASAWRLYYNLNPMYLDDGSYNYTDTLGDTYYVNVCGGLEHSPCNNTEAAVCIQRENGDVISGGKATTADLSLVLPGQVAISYYEGDRCGSVPYSSRIQMKCVEEGKKTKITAVTIENCVIQISMKSPLACPVSSSIESYSSSSSAAIRHDGWWWFLAIGAPTAVMICIAGVAMGVAFYYYKNKDAYYEMV